MRTKFKEALTLRFVEVLILVLVLMSPILLTKKPRVRERKYLAGRWQRGQNLYSYFTIHKL